MHEGIDLHTPVRIAKRDGSITVNLYRPQARMCRAIKRAVKRGLLKRAGGPDHRAAFRATNQEG